MSQSPSPNDVDTSNDNHAALKRRIAALEEQNAELRGESGNKRHSDPYLSAGRAIRRLVSLTDRVEDLVGEYDRRISLDDEPAIHKRVCLLTFSCFFGADWIAAF
ncbi:hypothetical protein M405DRAFT_870125 [Rhizopogon salebrosus TDB-379]|nr:hypothetical protein M405DRAFT_870125 [Rhizopogon salebrosus TDB-379]